MYSLYGFEYIVKIIICNLWAVFIISINIMLDKYFVRNLKNKKNIILPIFLMLRPSGKLFSKYTDQVDQTK